METRLIIALLLSFTLWGVYAVEDKKVWDHHRLLDSKGNYQLYWTAGKQNVTFLVEVATAGWVGFGISAHEGFMDSDIIVGGVQKGKAYFVAYQVDTAGQVTLDKGKSWTLISSSEAKGRTSLKFVRNLDQCYSEYIRTTPGDSQHILYTYSSSDPQSRDKIPVTSMIWNVTMLKLFQPRVTTTTMPADVTYYDLRMANFSVPGNLDTFIACRIMRGPQLSTKHHIIKVTSVIRPKNIELVHHLFVTKCTSPDVQELERIAAMGTYDCLSTMSPTLSGSCVLYYHGWGYGGGPFIYPTKAGQPLGEQPLEYFMLQIHYDNPTFQTGIVDDSGVRFYYTPNLRKYESETVIVGYPIISKIIVPPGQRQFLIDGHGHPRCFSQAFPKEGIRAFAALLHAHSIGTAIKLRHFRNNKELPPIMADMHYSHHHQEYVYLEKDVIILPNDQLTVECTYDSSNLTTTVFGQQGTRDEMCNLGLYYYPRTALAASMVNINPAIVAGATGMTVTQVGTSVSPVNDYAAYVAHLLNHHWSQDTMCTFQNALRYFPQEAFCVMNDTQVIVVPHISFPEGFKLYSLPSSCKKSTDLLSEGIVFKEPCGNI